jgi:hypothetical protein
MPQTSADTHSASSVSISRNLYWPLSVHALLLAFLVSLPHWLILCKNHGDYSPFSVSPLVSALTFDETHAYAPPARHFMSTGAISAEVDNFERRDMSAGIPFVPAAILGSMGWVLGSLEWAFIIADCLFPTALFLLFYWLTGLLIRERGFRLLVAWSSVLVPFGLLNSLWLGDDALIAPLEITRTPQPEISFLFLICAAVLLGRGLVSPPTLKWTVAAGAASGAIVYCYYFYALAWGITLGLVLFFGLRWKARLVWPRLMIVLCIMILLAVPYVIASLRGQAQGGQAALLERMGAYTHRPDVLPLTAAFLLTVALLVFGRKFCSKQPMYFLLTALVAGALYAMNFQVLSGYETQPWHFWKRLALPICFFLIVSLVMRLAEATARQTMNRLRVGARVILFLLIIETGARLTYASVSVAPFHRATNSSVAMLRWVRSHISAGQVIGTVDPQLILLIPALTADYTYVPSGLRSLTPTTEIVGRYLELAGLLGLSTSEVAREAAIPNHLGRSTELLQVLGLSYTGDHTVYEWFVNQYREAQLAHDHISWRLDYLVIPARLSEDPVKRQFPSTRVIYKNSDYCLLKLSS